ncbi:MAG: HlyC/CorC family transporter [Alphaproteobacteria bacterium]
MTVEIAAIALLIVFLLVVSALFSASETALAAASRLRIDHLARKGHRRARIVDRMRAHKERMVTSLLLGNNLVNILASALATSLFLGWFGEAGIAYATLAMTALIVVFSEVMPKTYAINHPERTALAVAPTVRAIIALLAPVAVVLTAFVQGCLRGMGIQVASGSLQRITDEELRGAIELHAEGPAGGRHKRGMLRSILDLDHVEVREVMTHRRHVETIEADLPPATIIERVLASPFTRIPLWQEKPDNIIGVLHAKAVLRAVRGAGTDLGAVDIRAITGKPWFTPETTSLLQQLQAFRDRREHFALVVDEYGALMGVITLEDIIEDIVGEIPGEHDVPVSGVRAQPDGSFIVAGAVTLRDLNREFDWNLPDDEASTVAGLLLYESRRIPRVGQIFNFYGFRFEVLRRMRNQITSVLIRPPSGPPPDQTS